MIVFKPVTLCDKAWVDELVLAENSPSADYNFGNIYIWDKRYRQLISRCGDRMLTKLRYAGKPFFVFPIGRGPLRPAVETLRAYAMFKCYHPFCLRGITEENRRELEAEYPGCFVYEEDTDNADYIYLAEKLSTYAGKALHGKKNHCNRFEAENDWDFAPLTRALIPGCLDMLDIWSGENMDRLDKSVSYEHDAIIRAFALLKKAAAQANLALKPDKMSIEKAEAITAACSWSRSITYTAPLGADWCRMGMAAKLSKASLV